MTERFKIAPGEVICASSNHRHVMGAAAFGVRTAWINHTHLPQEYEPGPNAAFIDLYELITVAR